MNKRVGALLVSLLLVVPSVANASSTSVIIAPATPDVHKGNPEKSKPQGINTPNDVIVGPIFDGYDHNKFIEVDKFRQIAVFSHDNRRNVKPYTMKVSVSKSESQGSEWSGNIQFTGSIKAGILADIEASVGAEYKDSRTRNEAVGAEGSFEVSPKKKGFIGFWYRGQTSKGVLKTYTYYTANPTKRTYKETPINATVYESDYVNVHSDAWEE
ncbi:hypothetical protein A616_16920 [Brevibacillus brevis X23]|nr:hypothetical protein A616_16920 [Brevibacillus brevis X23]